jgi:hypothetical protein
MLLVATTRPQFHRWWRRFVQHKHWWRWVSRRGRNGKPARKFTQTLFIGQVE